MGAIETLMEQVMEQGQEQTGQIKKVVRKYSAAFKASVVAECGQPGVTKAEIARKYGIHTSVMYRWVGQMRQTEPARESVSTPEVPPTTASVPSSAQAVGPTPIQTTEQTTAPAGLPRGFIPIATAAPSSEVIHIQVHSAASQVHIRWPSSAAAQCVQWMRDGLGVCGNSARTDLCRERGGNLRPYRNHNFGECFNRINSMSADFVLCSKDSTIVAVIELDEVSQGKAARQATDAKKDKVLGERSDQSIAF